MDTKAFNDTWWAMSSERDGLISRLSELETELNEVRNKISHLDEVLNHLAPLADLPYYDENDFRGLGITDAIRFILKHAAGRLSGKEVRLQLVERNYDLSSLTAPMASIYKILSRLEESGKVEREKEDGNVYYKWKAAPITDEDIPF
jgi:DNA-binding transcriptional ArsR family regulator